MKMRIEHFTTLLILTIMLAGCSGCGQKHIDQTPIDASTDDTSEDTAQKTQPEKTPEIVSPSTVKSDDVTSKPRGKTAQLSTRQFRDRGFLKTLKGVEYIEHTREDRGGVPLPWDPMVVPIEWYIRWGEKYAELRIAIRQKKITIEEGREKMLQFYREYGLVASMQLYIELDGSISDKISRVVDLAYSEDPNDFDTLLLWVLAGGHNRYSYRYGEEKRAATRRLYEMNPDHPWVLHYLAKCLLGPAPEEALIYAQKAQELDARYLRLGLVGACYYQIGDYEAALDSFRRSRQYAVDTSQPDYMISAISSWVGTTEDVLNSGGAGEDVRERFRKGGTPLLGPGLPTPLRQ